MTDKCNLCCVDCCCNVPQQCNRWEADLPYLANAAEHMRGKIDWVQMTGGEPLMNSKIDQLVPVMRDLFQIRRLTMETNGFLVDRHPGVVDCLDDFYVTHYDARVFRYSVDKGVDNTLILERLRERYGHKCNIVHPMHIPRSKSPTGVVCGRGTSNVASYWQGKVYPCCVAPGIHGSLTTELSSGWEDRVRDLPPPCHKCWFSA